MEKSQNNQNILDLIPIHNKEWGKRADGTIYLKKDRFKNPFLNKMVGRLGIPPQIHIHLDEFGSFVWHQCNGSQPVSEIAKKLHERFGDRVNPVYERLSAYIKQLAYQKFIAYKINSDES